MSFGIDGGGEVVLVLEAGDLLVGRDPAVAVAVDADEDVALREVGAVELAGRVRAGAELEHDRREAHALDRGARGASFVGELAQGRADEDPDPLVGRADHGPVSPSHVHIMARIGRVRIHSARGKTEPLRSDGGFRGRLQRRRIPWPPRPSSRGRARARPLLWRRPLRRRTDATKGSYVTIDACSPTPVSSTMASAAPVSTPCSFAGRPAQRRRRRAPRTRTPSRRRCRVGR